MNKTFDHIIAKTYSIADIYGTDDPKIPEGYEAVEFRLVKEGDFWLNVVTKTSAGGPASFNANMEADKPRIILRKLPTPKDFYGTYNPEIPKGYRSLGLGKIKEGDHYLSGYDTWKPGCEISEGRALKAVPAMVGKYRIILEELPEPTIDSVYGNPNPTIPDGWEKVDFRIPEMGEYFLPKLHMWVEQRYVSDWKGATIDGGPRIILRRKKNREVPDSELVDYVLDWIWKEVPPSVIDGYYGTALFATTQKGDPSDTNVKTWKSSIREMLAKEPTSRKYENE